MKTYTIKTLKCGAMKRKWKRRRERRENVNLKRERGRRRKGGISIIGEGEQSSDFKFSKASVRNDT